MQCEAVGVLPVVSDPTKQLLEFSNLLFVNYFLSFFSEKTIEYRGEIPVTRVFGRICECICVSACCRRACQ